MSQDLIAEWEARLAREGLAPISLGSGVSDRHLDLCTEGYTGAAAPDSEEVAQMDRILLWLPEADRQALELLRHGATQRDIARALGIERRSARELLTRAEGRALALATGPLPRDREDLGRRLWFVWGRHRRPGREPRWSRVRAVLLTMAERWTAEGAARSLGVSPSTVRAWRNRLAMGDDHAVATLYSAIRRHPTCR